MSILGGADPGEFERTTSRKGGDSRSKEKTDYLSFNRSYWTFSERVSIL